MAARAPILCRITPAAALSALALLAACSEPMDLDLRRDMGSSFDTSGAVGQVAGRPQPDARGVISYPNTQVVVAQPSETPRQIAGRLGLDAQQLAAFNGLDPDVPLREGELVALPARVGGTAPAGGTIAAPRVDVTELASAAIDRAAPQQTAPTPVAAAAPARSEPIRHPVRRGETVYSISRLYGVSVRDIANWNGLGPDLAIREGQQLLIPQAGTAAPTTQTAAVITQPGQPSPTPAPPSASQPLPQNDPARAAPAATTPPPSPDLGAERSQPAGSARFVMPVNGSIIRDYSAGRNEGIDIGAPAGTPVRAAADGTVAAVTTDTNGASIVVVRHPDGLLTVYVNLTDLAVAKGDAVARGQTIARIPAGDPSFVHFEVRDGLESVDPTGYLP